MRRACKEARRIAAAHGYDRLQVAFSATGLTVMADGDLVYMEGWPYIDYDVETELKAANFILGGAGGW